MSQTILDESSTQLPTEPPNTFSSLKIDQLMVQSEVIYKILSQLNIRKAMGPDGISNLILREAAVPLAEPLSNLFNYCNSLGHFAELWKIANVLPLYKKDDSLLCNNYCPISLLPCISKVFERVLFNHIFGYLNMHSLIKKNQSGFIPGDSTTNQMIATCNQLYKCIDEEDEMVSVFLVFSKAFDNVAQRSFIQNWKVWNLW